MAADEGVGRVEEPVDAPLWEVVPGAGWSREELEGLLASGVRLVGSEDVPAVDEESASWLDELERPEHGPVSWLGERAPSGALLTDLESWAAAEVVTDYDALEVVAAWHRVEAYAAAGKRRAAAALARREVLAGALAHLQGQDILVGEPGIAADELALRIGISKPAARGLVRAGRCMGGAGLLVGEALAAGEIDAVKADAICEAIQDLGADAALEVQERVLGKAGHLSAGGVRRELALACAAVRPEEFGERCERAAATRRVDRPRVLPNGMAGLYAVLPAVEATQVYRTLDAAARSGKTAGDPRTLDQLRADALAAMGWAALQTGWIGPAPVSEGGSGAGAGRGRAGGGIGTAGAGVAVDGAAGLAESNDGRAPRVTGSSDDGPAGPLRCGSMRVGVIGGRSAHVRVVVPCTMLMDADPTVPPDPPGPPPGRDPEVDSDDLPGVAGVEAGPPGLAPCDEPGSGVPPGTAGAVEASPGVAGVGGASLPGASGGEYGGGGAGGLPVSGAAWPELLGVAQLDGYGPIPAAVARALAAGSSWARMVVDPVDRTVLELSKATYEPAQSMVDLVTAAQPRCVRPGCEVGADSCDIHHRIPWPVGATEPGNLDPDCRRDHLLVTHAGWHYEQDESDHSRTWTTRTGHRYTVDRDGTIRMLPRPAHLDEPPPF